MRLPQSLEPVVEHSITPPIQQLQSSLTVLLKPSFLRCRRLVPYCENIPPDLVNTVVCDPSFHLDDWSVGAGYNTNDVRIPQGKILAIPFTSTAVGLDGTVTITNNTGLVATGFRWRGWFSLVPGRRD